MRRTWRAGIAGVVLVGGLSTGVVLAAADPDDDNKGQPSAEDRGRSDKDHGRGFGPPSWAHGSGSDARGHDAKGHDKAWKDAWKALSAQERKQLIRGLASAHAEGMRDFATCVAGARAADEATDEAAGKAARKAARADCEKPLPPGHAKRQAVS